MRTPLRDHAINTLAGVRLGRHLARPVLREGPQP